ncbi:helix-turn-helix transcriptional regulator [Vibrio parahaemolyticus]
MELLRINDACHVTGLSRKTIYRYMEKGILDYQEIDGKRYVNLSDLKSTQFTKKQKNRTDTKNDTNLEINSLKEEIKLLKNSILELNKTIRQMVEEPKGYVSNKKNDTQKSLVSKERLSGDNERRAEEAKNRVFNALNKLLETNSLPMYRGKISPSGVQRETGIDRGTISKYLEEWTELNDYGKNNN